MRSPLPLRAIIPSAFLAVVCMQLLLLFLYDSIVISKDVLRDLHKSAQDELNHFSANLVQSYHSKDKTAAALELAMLASSPSVRMVITADETDTIRECYPYDLANRPLGSAVPRVLDSVLEETRKRNIPSYFQLKNSYFAAAPFYTKISEGSLSVKKPSLLIIEYDINSFGESIHRTGRINSLIFSITMLIAALAVFFYINEAVVKRARKIIKETDSFVSSGYTGRTTVTGSDELGLIAQAVNRMADDVQQNRLELVKSEIRFRSIFESMPLIALELDRLGTVTYANPFLCRLTGWSIEEIIGMNWFNTFIPKSDQVNINDIFNYLLEEQHLGTTPAVENTILAKDGTKRLIRWSNLLIGSDSHRSIVSIGEDITQKAEKDEEIARQTRLESLSQLSAGIAHDFNNIFAILFGFIDLAGTAIDRKDHSSAREYIKNAMDAFQRARALSDQLLTFSKGGAPIKSGADLAELIRTCTTFILSGSGVSIRYDMPDSFPPALFDRNQISRVFENLAVNSRDAMDSSGEVLISAALRADNFEITFSDTGSGIPDDIARHIFDPFYTTKSFGHGLGLAAVHSIISQHDGSIAVQSSCRGTVFSITLPFYPAPAVTVPETAVPDKAMVKGSQILILDDEEMILKMMRISLERAGFHVSTATDGFEAVSLYQDQYDAGSRFSCAILDLTLPGGIDGKQAASEILKIDPEAVLFVSSGYSDDPVMSSPQEYGFSGALVKPYQFHELLAMIRPLQKT